MESQKPGNSGLEVSAIHGKTKSHHLKENLGGDEITQTDEELKSITVANSKIELTGSRYPEALEKTTGL